MDASVISIIIALAVALYYFSTKTYNYWTERKVKGPKPQPLFGNLTEFVFRKESLGRLLEKIYHAYPSERYVGIYKLRTPALLIRDLDLIKLILIKEFDKFQDRGIANQTDRFHKNLFSLEGDEWRVLRQKLTPVFTSGKLRNMFYLVTNCANNLENYIEKIIDSKTDHEIRDLTGKYTLQAICNCAFGIEVETFEDDDNIYSKIGNRIFENEIRIAIQQTLNTMFPGFLEKLGVSSWKKDVVDFYLKLVADMLNEREGKPKVRHDFMDLLIEMREQGTVKGSNKKDELLLEMTDELIAAQAFIFYAAGFETSSGTMAFMLYELSQNEDIQERVRNEVDDIYNRYGDITYDSVKQLVYLDLVMSETLRKYPVGEFLIRECNEDFPVPGDKLTIEKGVTIFIPLRAIQHDSKHFPEQEKFIPERFNQENKHLIHSCAYLPFGEGPRMCIGMRFAKVQVLVGIAKILRRFKVKSSTKMPDKLSFDPLNLTLQCSHGIWVNFDKRHI